MYNMGDKEKHTKLTLAQDSGYIQCCVTTAETFNSRNGISNVGGLISLNLTFLENPTYILHNCLYPHDAERFLTLRLLFFLIEIYFEKFHGILKISVYSASDSVSPSLSAPPLFMLCLSLSQK